MGLRRDLSYFDLMDIVIGEEEIFMRNMAKQNRFLANFVRLVRVGYRPVRRR